MIAESPGRKGSEEPTPVRVRGSCSHEWVATTIKAATIRAGGSIVKLNCPSCVAETDWNNGKRNRKKNGREVLRKVVCAEAPERFCTDSLCKGGPTRLNVYNPGDTCGACRDRIEKAQAAKMADYKGRILEYLGRAPRTAPWLAAVLGKPVPEVKHLLLELIAARKVERGAMHSSGQRFYRLAVGG